VDVLIYNREFIKENFEDADDLRGIFTLGKGSKEAKTRIAVKKREAAACASLIDGLQGVLTKAESELAQTEIATAEACWKTVDPRRSVFREAFAGGHLASHDAFMQELLRHRDSNAELQTLSWLKDKAQVVFDASPEPLPPVPVLDSAVLTGYEDEPLLETKIVASGDVPIAVLIERMGNSDWLRQGQDFLERSEGRCPFCQQGLPEDLEQQMAAIFNEEYVRLTSEYEVFVDRYRRAVQDVRDACERILSTENEYFVAPMFQAGRDALLAESAINLGRLEAKRKEPSTVVDLVSLKGIFSDLQSLITSANEKTADHNKTVADAANQKGLLTEQIWKHLADVALKPLLDKYVADQRTKSKEIRETRELIKDKAEKLDGLDGEIKVLEGQVTDVSKVLNDINQRLKSFGFRGFSLGATADGKGYRIIRGDGSPARENLSEGERSFVTFLYFYHLIDGSHDTSGATNDKVVVFDDPVSSMDSEVLFIVSTLIRMVCERATDPQSHIVQVFVLTHNVYFFKEVSFDRKKATRDTYWMVRKPDSETKVKGFGAKNPITTSYQLLWDEIGVENPPAATIQNNIRRILEHYFQFLGNTKIKDIPSKFNDDDPDKVICLSMVSWIHDGSHSIADDIVYSSLDSSMVKKYLTAFRRVFEETGQIDHYLMMCSSEMRAQYEKDKAGLVLRPRGS
jgi:wobble nucleotide-excising tRNase